LDLVPQVQEFLVQENLDDDLDEVVLQKLLCKLPNLRALDFCASSSSRFTEAFAAVVNPANDALPQVLALKDLACMSVTHCLPQVWRLSYQGCLC
jgi:hypothetical protein